MYECVCGYTGDVWRIGGENCQQQNSPSCSIHRRRRNPCARHQTPHIMWMCSGGHCALRQILFNIIIAFVCNLICHLGPINRIFSQFFRPRYEMKHYDVSETSTHESAILEYSYSRARTLTTTTKVIANQYNWEFVPRSTNKNSQTIFVQTTWHQKLVLSKRVSKALESIWATTINLYINFCYRKVYINFIPSAIFFSLSIGHSTHPKYRIKKKKKICQNTNRSSSELRGRTKRCTDKQRVNLKNRKCPSSSFNLTRSVDGGNRR